MNKILVLANNDTGLYNLRKELLEKLISENFQVYISLPNGEKINKLEEIGCKFIETNIDRRGTNILKDTKLVIKYMKLLKEIKPNIVLTYTIKPNLYGGLACKLKKIPYIINITGLGSVFERKSILSKIIITLYKTIFKKAECIFCQNKGNLEFFKNKGIANDKLQLIPGSGVNLEKFKLLEYPNDDKKIEFLFSGRIMKEKGIDEFFEMAKIIKQKYPNTIFNILGFCEEEYEEQLKELEKKDIVKFYGMQNDVISFLEKSHCIILPSYHEGMSNVLLEAGASGRPLISTDVNGCKEAIDNDINGYIVKVKDTKDLIEKVEKFLNLSNEQKKEMGLRGREKIKKEFNRQLIVDAYMNKINKIKESVGN